MEKGKEYGKDLINFISKSGSAYHGTKAIKDKLKDNGYIELREEEAWDINKNGKYYIINNMCGIIAFKIGKGEIEEEGFKIVGCHLDTPTLKIKSIPEIISEKNYIRLNVEVYGGPILSTFLDRPLSIAGIVSIKTQNPLKPEKILIDINKPLVVIPNIAIHMNRNVNKGFELNPQKDMLPLLGMVKDDLEDKNYLLNIISKEVSRNIEDILDFDLFLYEWEKGTLVGRNEELISASKLDDLSSAHAGLEGIINSREGKGISVLACFDSEEVGSSSLGGANSPFLSSVLERISIALHKNREEYFRAFKNSFLISSDSAHGVHPNAEEKSDPTNKPILNNGIVIKTSANKKYTSNAESVGIFKMICKKADVPYQTFVNRSDMVGGSTIGPITQSHLSIKTVDIGNPILGMHSIRELGGVSDHYYLIKALEEFFSL